MGGNRAQFFYKTSECSAEPISSTMILKADFKNDFSQLLRGPNSKAESSDSEGAPVPTVSGKWWALRDCPMNKTTLEHLERWPWKSCSCDRRPQVWWTLLLSAVLNCQLDKKTKETWDSKGRRSSPLGTNWASWFTTHTGYLGAEKMSVDHLESRGKRNWSTYVCSCG